MLGKRVARKALIVLFLSAIVVLPACSQLERAVETSEIKDVVKGYNRGLIISAKTGNVENLQGLADQDVLRKLHIWIAAWQDSQTYMDAQLRAIVFSNIAISGKTARARTSESWIYAYRGMKTGEIAVPASGIDYNMEYVLRKYAKTGKWMITEINIKSEKDEGPGMGLAGKARALSR